MGSLPLTEGMTQKESERLEGPAAKLYTPTDNETLLDLSEQYSFFQYQLLHLFSGLDGDLLHDFLSDHPGTDIYYLDLPKVVVRNVPIRDASPEAFSPGRRIYLISRLLLPALDEFFLTIRLLDYHKKFLAQVFKQQVLIEDVLALTPPSYPMIVLNNYSLSTNKALHCIQEVSDASPTYCMMNPTQEIREQAKACFELEDFTI